MLRHRFSNERGGGGGGAEPTSSHSVKMSIYIIAGITLTISFKPLLLSDSSETLIHLQLFHDTPLTLSHDRRSLLKMVDNKRSDFM